MVTASPIGSSQIHQIATGGESILADRILVVGSPFTVTGVDYIRLELITGVSQYSIEETISVDLPISGTIDIGTYLTISQTSTTLTLTPVVDGYLHDLIGIG